MPRDKRCAQSLNADKTHIGGFNESGLDISACLGMKNIGKPCAGKSHARFDEGGLPSGSSLLYSNDAGSPQQLPAEKGDNGLAVADSVVSDHRGDLVGRRSEQFKKFILIQPCVALH